MTIADFAVAVRNEFAEPDRLVMLAIAGAESAFRPEARGDNLSEFNSADRARYGPWACADYLSFGGFQVFLPVWHSVVTEMSHLDGACPLANWLMNPANNTRVARRILDQQGLTAWSTYKNEAYQQFLNEAGAALAALPPAPAPEARSPIVAVSFAVDRVHFDRADGTFDERTITTAGSYGPWWRLDLDQPTYV